MKSYPCYLTLDGSAQGRIEGSVREGPHAGKILLRHLEHHLGKPIDMEHLRPAGREQHTPLYVTKWLDRASPRLASALANREPLEICRIQYYTPGQNGQDVALFVINLFDAVVSSIETWVPTSRQAPSPRPGSLERIGLRYRTIQWQHWLDSTEAKRTWALDC